jgi:Flp pilus assembly protein TadD
VRQSIAELERALQAEAETIGLPPDRYIKGLRHHEQGQRYLHEEDYRACIAANRQACKFLGAWPPPHNNLSLALFFDGRPEQAIATARRVLDRHPDNVQALSNAIRFLAWTGQRAEAGTLWAHLRRITPEDDDTRLKAAGAAAVMEDDQRVYELLEPLAAANAVPSRIRPDLPLIDVRARFFLAVAGVNLGKRGARRRLRSVLSEMPWLLEGWAEALKAGKPGPGWAERFPYHYTADILSPAHLLDLIGLMESEDRLPPARFQRNVARFVERFPQVVLTAEKLIWEEMEPGPGIHILEAVGTPAAHAALRRFGLSQAGDDENRMDALYALARAGQITPDETLRVWIDGEWLDMQIRPLEISDEPGVEYSDEVVDLLEDALEASQEGDLSRAEEGFQRVLELEPRSRDAHNNLGTIYAQRGEHERAREMFRESIEIDPLYVFPRCNLANYLLSEDDLDGAIEMLKPLTQLTRFHPQEMALYSTTQARIAIELDELDRARDLLESALDVYPDYEPAEHLQARLQMRRLFGEVTSSDGFFASVQERQAKRDRAWRARLQARLSTADPSLPEALPLLTREALQGTARKVVPVGGWSGLRKAELIERLIDELTSPHNLERVVGTLADVQHDALQQVLARGGHMPWQDFDAAYDNDLDESRFWQWHEPKSSMGQLRLRGLLVEATVDGELLVAVPLELRQMLEEALSRRRG